MRQWKAADAAEKAAWWAAFAGWFGGLGFIGVLAAIGLAFHSNWIVRDTAQRQLRAYVSWHKVTMDFNRNRSGVVVDARLLITWKNEGQTPAYEFISDLEWTIFEEEVAANFDYPVSKNFNT